MIELDNINEIYLYTGSTDFRCGIYGLSRIVLNQFDKDNIKHDLFLFCSKSKKGLKILEFENNGVWMYYKKIDVRKFIYPDSGTMGIISKDELRILLSGLNFIYRIEGKLDKKYDLF